MGERTIDFLVRSHSGRSAARRQSKASRKKERKNASVMYFCAEEPVSSQEWSSLRFRLTIIFTSHVISPHS